MPVSTPNLVAQPVLLENYGPAGIIRSDSNIIPYYNILTTSILPGEPVFHMGRIGISKKIILPGAIGELIFDWVADFVVNPALGAVILANAVVYWDYDLNGVSGGVTLPAGVGCVAASSPTNGFILGRAIISKMKAVTLSSGKAIAASPGDERIRVVAQTLAVSAIGTIPTFN